jgi:hypothetical protein
MEGASVMKHIDKQPKRASKADMSRDQRQPASDMSPHAAKGGDKQSNEPLRRHLKGGSGQPQTSPGKKPGQ